MYQIGVAPSNLLKGIRVDISNHGTGILSDDRIQDLDAEVWDSKGMLAWFPGDIQLLDNGYKFLNWDVVVGFVGPFLNGGASIGTYALWTGNRPGDFVNLTDYYGSREKNALTGDFEYKNTRYKVIESEKTFRIYDLNSGKLSLILDKNLDGLFKTLGNNNDLLGTQTLESQPQFKSLLEKFNSIRQYRKEYVGADLNNGIQNLWNNADILKRFVPPLPSFRNIGKYINDAFASASRGLFDPLVLDLDGDGIELISIDKSNVQFDLNADGFREQTGWVKGDDGMLALDANGDGLINNITELFGDATTDGFDELKTLDSNNDKVINASDTKFGELCVWQDLNQNGITDTGELKTLAQLNIASISLTTAAANVTNNGNLIRTTGKYTRTNGTQNEAVSLWFAADRLNTSYDKPYQLEAEVIFMPTVRGYGGLPDLYIAMSLDSKLLGLVRDFVSLKSINPEQIYSKVEAILFRWAEVDGIVPTSRGQYLDARKIGFLEKILQQPLPANIPSANRSVFIPNISQISRT